MSPRVAQLLVDGEWACSYGDPPSLRATCEELGALMRPGLARKCQRVVSLSRDDMWRAVEEWEEIVDQLREAQSRARDSANRGSRDRV